MHRTGRISAFAMFPCLNAASTVLRRLLAMAQGNLTLEICMDRKCQILMLDFGFIVRHCSGGYMQSERKKVICKIESHLNSKIYPS